MTFCLHLLQTIVKNLSVTVNQPQVEILVWVRVYILDILEACTSESCEKRAKSSSRWNLKSWSGATRGIGIGSGGCVGGGGAPASRDGAVAKASGERSAVGEGGKRIRGEGGLRRRALLQRMLLASRCSPALLWSAPLRRSSENASVDASCGVPHCLRVYMYMAPCVQPHAHAVFYLFIEGEGGPIRYLFSNFLLII